MRKCIEQDSYTAQQIFTVDTNGLVAEKKPARTFKETQSLRM